MLRTILAQITPNNSVYWCIFWGDFDLRQSPKWVVTDDSRATHQRNSPQVALHYYDDVPGIYFLALQKSIARSLERLSIVGHGGRASTLATTTTVYCFDEEHL